MKWFQFMLGALATYRLAKMISGESGPGLIFRKLRGLPDPKKHPSVKEGLSCLCCTSFSIAALMAGYFVWLEWAVWAEAPLYWFAFSGAAVALHFAIKE